MNVQPLAFKPANNPVLNNLLLRMISASHQEQVKFILHPSAHPEIVVLVHVHVKPLLEHVIYLTRTLAYNMHRRKLILTGRWHYFKNQNYRPFITTSKRKVPVSNHSLVSGNTSSTQRSLTSTASGPTPTTSRSRSTCSMSANNAQSQRGGSDQPPC